MAGGQRPSGTSARTTAGSFRSRSVLAMWLRLLPITSANCSWRIIKALGEIVITRRLLDGVEIGTLHVFDQGDLEHLLVAQLTDDHRDLCMPARLRRAPAPLAGDDLVAAAARHRAAR